MLYYYILLHIMLLLITISYSLYIATFSLLYCFARGKDGKIEEATVREALLHGTASRRNRCWGRTGGDHGMVPPFEVWYMEVVLKITRNSNDLLVDFFANY